MMLEKMLLPGLLSLFFALGSPVLSSAQNGQPPLLMEIRNNLSKAFQDEKVCDPLYAKVKDVKSSDPLLKGYIGAVHMARAKHVAIVDKMAAFKKGRGILEDAVQAMPNSLELHFLRMTIQLNLPKFIGYNDNIKTDKKFVFDNFKIGDPKLKERIANFVKTSGHFSAEEQARLKG